jgi:hypothetical protein
MTADGTLKDDAFTRDGFDGEGDLKACPSCFSDVHIHATRCPQCQVRIGRSGATRNSRPAVAVGGLLVAATFAFAIGAYTRGFGGTSQIGLGTAATTLSLRQRTEQYAQLLRESLCNSARASSGCSINSTPGAIDVRLRHPFPDDLRDAGNESKLWTNADVARIEHTRAIDGTQRALDGKMSWTYHPDDGLSLVITIDENSPDPSPKSPA